MKDLGFDSGVGSGGLGLCPKVSNVRMFLRVGGWLRGWTIVDESRFCQRPGVTVSFCGSEGARLLPRVYIEWPRTRNN